jgi:type I restriction enzyme S subunit
MKGESKQKIEKGKSAVLAYKQMKLSEVVHSFVNGGTPSTENPDFWRGNIPWVTGSDFENQKVIIGRRFTNHVAVKKSATNVIPKGNILVLSRTGVGKIAITPCDIAISQDITALIVNQDVCTSSFLFWNLNARTRQMQRWAQGTSIQGFTREDLEAFPLSVPEKGDQLKITELLDSVELLISNTREIIKNYDSLKDCLIDDWIKETAKRKSNLQQLGSLICNGPQNGIYVHDSAYGSGAPILRINDFNGGDVLINAPQNRVRMPSKDSARYELRPGDLLVNRVNSVSHLGKTCLVLNTNERTIFESNMMRFSVLAEKAIPQFVLIILSSDYARSQIRGMAKRAIAQCSIDQNDLRSIRIPLPPIGEQKRLVELINAAESTLSLNSEYLRSLESLRVSLLGKLFA